MTEDFQECEVKETMDSLTLSFITCHRTTGAGDAALYLECLAQFIKAGEPIPDEMSGPLIDGLEKAAEQVRAADRAFNNDRLEAVVKHMDAAKKQLCEQLGIYRNEWPDLNRFKTADETFWHVWHRVLGRSKQTIKQISESTEQCERHIKRRQKEVKEYLQTEEEICKRGVAARDSGDERSELKAAIELLDLWQRVHPLYRDDPTLDNHRRRYSNRLRQLTEG